MKIKANLYKEEHNNVIAKTQTITLDAQLKILIAEQLACVINNASGYTRPNSVAHISKFRPVL